LPSGQSSAWTLECVRANRPWLCSWIEVGVSGKRKGASWEACALFYLYF